MKEQRAEQSKKWNNRYMTANICALIHKKNINIESRSRSEILKKKNKKKKKLQSRKRIIKKYIRNLFFFEEK